MTEFEVGQKAFMEKNISEEDVRHFAGISGDDNPLHLDETYAAGSRFGKRVVHGILVASLISGVIGTKLPGKGTIYLSQSLKFLKPVFIGDTIRAEVEITKLDTERRRIALETRVIRSDGACVLAGEALVIPPENQYCGAKPVLADIDRGGGVNLIFHRKA